jgi:hypothetical protein
VTEGGGGYSAIEVGAWFVEPVDGCSGGHGRMCVCWYSMAEGCLLMLLIRVFKRQMVVLSPGADGGRLETPRWVQLPAPTFGAQKSQA